MVMDGDVDDDDGDDDDESSRGRQVPSHPFPTAFYCPPAPGYAEDVLHVMLLFSAYIQFIHFYSLLGPH